MKKSIILLAALLALPSFSNAAKQTWTSGEQLSSVRTKILANDTELYAQAATKWVTGTAYTADNQMVVYGGNIYVCATNHTAGTFATDLAAARWKFWGSDIYATIGHNHTGTYLPLTGGALSGTLELGAASTTTGNLRFYNALAPHPVGLYSIGSNYADVNFRLPGELPLAIGSLYVDTAGHMGFWGLDTDLSSTSSSDDTIPSAKATKTGLDGKEPSLGNPSTNGYVLSSTTGGTRSWIAPATGGSMTWPSTAGIPYWTSGTAWGGAYTLDTDLSSVSASDDTIPSAKATKAALDGKLPLAGGAMTGTLSFGVASTTSGLANFYNSGAAYPTGIYSVGAASPSVGLRLPGTMPTGNSTFSVDTNGYMSFWLMDTDLATTSASDDTVPSAKATKAALDGKQATLTNPLTQSDIDDTPSDGNTTQPASSNSVFDGLVLKEPTQTAASQAEAEAGTEAAIRSMSPLRIFQAIAAYFAANVDPVSADVETMMGSANNAAIRSNIGAQAAADAVYPSATSTSTGTGNINIDGVSADHYYFSNGASTATYTPVITSAPASNYERGVVLTVGGGAGVITMTWTNVSFLGTAGAATTTTNKYSHYGCFIRSTGNAICKIIAEAADF